MVHVGDNAKGPKHTIARPAVKVRFAVDVEVCAEPTAEPTKQVQCAPIKMVSRCAENPRCRMGESQCWKPSKLATPKSAVCK